MKKKNEAKTNTKIDIIKRTAKLTNQPIIFFDRDDTLATSASKDDKNTFKFLNEKRIVPILQKITAYGICGMISLGATGKGTEKHFAKKDKEKAIEINGLKADQFNPLLEQNDIKFTNDLYSPLGVGLTDLITNEKNRSQLLEFKQMYNRGDVPKGDDLYEMKIGKITIKLNKEAAKPGGFLSHKKTAEILNRLSILECSIDDLDMDQLKEIGIESIEFPENFTKKSKSDIYMVDDDSEICSQINQFGFNAINVISDSWGNLRRKEINDYIEEVKQETKCVAAENLDQLKGMQGNRENLKENTIYYFKDEEAAKVSYFTYSQTSKVQPSLKEIAINETNKDHLESSLIKKAQDSNSPGIKDPFSNDILSDRKKLGYQTSKARFGEWQERYAIKPGAKTEALLSELNQLEERYVALKSNIINTLDRLQIKYEKQEDIPELLEKLKEEDHYELFKRDFDNSQQPTFKQLKEKMLEAWESFGNDMEEKLQQEKDQYLSQLEKITPQKKEINQLIVSNEPYQSLLNLKQYILEEDWKTSRFGGIQISEKNPKKIPQGMATILQTIQNALLQDSREAHVDALGQIRQLAGQKSKESSLKQWIKGRDDKTVDFYEKISRRAGSKENQKKIKEGVEDIKGKNVNQEHSASDDEQLKHQNSHRFR